MGPETVPRIHEGKLLPRFEDRFTSLARGHYFRCQELVKRWHEICPWEESVELLPEEDGLLRFYLCEYAHQDLRPGDHLFESFGLWSIIWHPKEEIMAAYQEVGDGLSQERQQFFEKLCQKNGSIPESPQAQKYGDTLIEIAQFYHRELTQPADQIQAQHTRRLTNEEIENIRIDAAALACSQQEKNLLLAREQLPQQSLIFPSSLKRPS